MKITVTLNVQGVLTAIANELGMMPDRMLSDDQGKALPIRQHQLDAMRALGIANAECLNVGITTINVELDCATGVPPAVASITYRPDQ